MSIQSASKTRMRRRRKQGGFTLIEMMSSMMILAIGMTAIIAMQKASLDTHAANRDMQVAGGIMDQFLEMLQVDALRWTAANRGSLTYLGPARAMSSGPTNNWWRYTQQPVNFQMRYATHSAGVIRAGTGARFCLYYKYSWAGDSANVTDFRDDLLEVNAAILTPRNPTGLTNTNTQCSAARTRFNTCSNLLINDNTCTIEARRTLFRRLSRTLYVRRNRSGN